MASYHFINVAIEACGMALMLCMMHIRELNQLTPQAVLDISHAFPQALMSRLVLVSQLVNCTSMALVLIFKLVCEEISVRSHLEFEPVLHEVHVGCVRVVQLLVGP